MADIRVNPGEVRTIATRVSAQGEAYLAEVKSLYTSVESLAAGWKGDDAKVYVDTINGYKTDIEALGQIINQYGTFLAKAANIYETASGENAAAAGKL